MTGAATTVERVVGHVAAGDSSAPGSAETPGTAGVDWVEIDWQQTVRRALRLTSASGRRVNVLLPRDAPTLRDGDVLIAAGAAGPACALRVRPRPLLRLRATSLRQMALLCTALGNAHTPVEVHADHLVTLDDGPTRASADELAVDIERFVAPFHPLRSSCQDVLRVVGR